MIVDVVRWHDHTLGCSRCSTVAAYYVAPYWRPTSRVCPVCCRELDALYRASGWPPEGRHDI